MSDSFERDLSGFQSVQNYSGRIFFYLKVLIFSVATTSYIYRQEKFYDFYIDYAFFIYGCLVFCKIFSRQNFAANKLAVAKSKLDLCEKILFAISVVKIVFCLAVIVLTTFFIFTKLSEKC